MSKQGSDIHIARKAHKKHIHEIVENLESGNIDLEMFRSL